MPLDSMRDLLVRELKVLYSAETQLVPLLPILARDTGARTLRESLMQLLSQTEHQVLRLEEIFDQLGSSPRGSHSQGMEGLIDEARAVHAGRGLQNVVDAALVSVVRRMVHYEIVVYGSAADHAMRLGFDGVADLLEKSLVDEEQADARFDDLATREVNARAMLALVASDP